MTHHLPDAASRPWRAAWIGLGANLPSHAGGPRETLSAARARIEALPHTRLSGVSRLYESSPVDADGPAFVNQVVRVQTALQARALLLQLQTIEQAFGRKRPFRNAPRTLDLDLLAISGEIHTDADLILPHPRLHQRLFVLMPLADLDPALDIPGQGSVQGLLDRLLTSEHHQDCQPMRRRPDEKTP